MEKDTGFKVCGIIAGVLISDGVLHPTEARFLQRLRRRFEVPKGAQIEPVGDHDAAIAMLQELPAEVRDEAVTLIVQAAAVDGHIAIGERIFLDAVAHSLDIAADDLEKRIQAALASEKAQPFDLAASMDDG